MEEFNPNSIFSAVDISKTSLDMTKSIISFFNLRTENTMFINDDMLNIVKNDNVYDFITMGEVLEHVNYPYKLLSKLKSLLSKSGQALSLLALIAQLLTMSFI